MLKKIVLPVVALVVMLILASAPAKAAVKFGITIGPPVYTYPAYPYYSDPYVYPNYNYSYPAPARVYPYFRYNWDSHRDHEREHRAPQSRGYERQDRGGNHGNQGGHRR